MNSVIKNLCWKEFHELKWGTVAAAAIALSIPLCYIFRDTGAAFLGVHTALWVYPLLAGVFFGMRAAAGERTSHTTSFVAALPVSIYVLGLVRLFVALIAAAVPPLVLLCLGAALGPLADQSARNHMLPMAGAFGWSMLGTACCLSIVAVAGLGQPTEVRAAVVGVATIIGLWLLGCLALLLLGLILARFPIENEWLASEPGTRWVMIGGVILMVALFLLLALSFISRYSRALASEPLAGSAEKRRELGDWMPRAISAQVATLIWKGGREMGVLGLQVFLVSLLLSLVVGTLGLVGNDPMSVAELVSKALPLVLWAGGFVLAILIGVGAVISDLQPGVNTFWRSRPISPQAWYWTKYLIGLATILLAIEIPSLICVGSVALATNELHDPLLGLLIWSATFSFATTATCLVRQPAHAAILAVGAAGILYAVIEATFGSFTPGEPGAPLAVLVPVFCCALVVSTVVGWWAAVRDVAIS